MIMPHIKEALLRMDEVALLELLDIQSSDLVEAFSDKIEEHLEKLLKEINET